MTRQHLNWQPIDTFPKDGKKYICFRETLEQGYSIATARWKDEEQAIGGNGWQYASFSMPTHWCEIPNLPSNSPFAEESNDDEHDYPEDFSHENGNYSNTCYKCNVMFTGHKRRVVCKKCNNPDLPQPTLPAEKRPLLVVLAYGNTRVVWQEMQDLGYFAAYGTPPRHADGWRIASKDEHLHGIRDIDIYIHDSFHSAPAWVHNPMMQTVNMLVASNFATILQEIPRHTEQ